MSRLLLKEVYYRQNKDIREYLDIYFETNLGILKNNLQSLDLIKFNELGELTRVEELDRIREKYGDLYIDEVRITYDSNMYILVSGKFIFAIEFIPNSNFNHSVQELRIIENIYSENKIEYDDFKELEILKLPDQN